MLDFYHLIKNCFAQDEVDQVLTTITWFEQVCIFRCLVTRRLRFDFDSTPVRLLINGH